MLTGRVRALGAMSGTSLDGVDAAMVETDGETVFAFGDSAYRPYTPSEREILRAALGQWEGPAVAAAGALVDEVHAEVLSAFADVDVVGYHGQTLAHDPRGRGTLQAGNGAWLADRLRRPVVWDFRSADVALGGEGAPLVPFFHFALARQIGVPGPVVFVNLGGVANLTWVNTAADKPDAPGALLAFDTGPANAPINDLMQHRRGQAQDVGGSLAATGKVEEAVVTTFLAHPYFDRPPPKSLDRNAWDALQEQVAHLDDADAAATLTACAALAVARGIDLCPAPPAQVWVAGGGRHNATLMAMIGAALTCPLAPVEAAGLNGDMLEAQAFAHLAVRVARGLPTSCPGTTGVHAAVGGGTISRPQAATR